MDIAESLATAEDFVPSDTETALDVNGCVFPQPEEGAGLTPGLISSYGGVLFHFYYSGRLVGIRYKLVDQKWAECQNVDLHLHTADYSR